MREEKRLVKRVILSFIPFSRITILEIFVETHSESLEIHFNFFGENYIFEISFCMPRAWDSYFSDANLIFSLFSASSGGAGAGTVGNNDNSESFEQGSEVAGGSRSSSAAAAEVEEIEEKHHPHFDRALMRSRRKSVSFAVCKVNKDTMQFDIEHKSVLLNKRGSGGGNGASGIGVSNP